MPFGPGFTGPLPVPARVTSLDAAASEVGEVMRVTVFVAKLLTHTDLPVDATAGATASLPGGAIRIDGPTADHRDALVPNFLEHLGTVRTRRTDQHFARDRVRLVALVFTKRLAELLVDPRHLKNGAVQHRGETRAVERADNFLRFA